jgi:colanic acid biosynthesis glycosyl transferase WcaI
MRACEGSISAVRVTLVSQYFWPENMKINDLVLEWKNRGWELEVLTGLPNYPKGKIFDGYRSLLPKREVWQGISVFRVPLTPRLNSNFFFLTLNYLSFLLTALFCFPFAFDRKTDFIFAMQFSPITSVIPAIFLKKIFRKPAVIWVQDIWPDSLVATNTVKDGRLLKLFTKICAWIYSRFDLVMVQSAAFEEILAEMGIPREKICYFPNWAEDIYKPIPLAQCTEYAKEFPHGFNILYAGNIGKAQAFETIIDAAQQLKEHRDINWIVIGDGRGKREAEDQIAAMGLSDRFYFLGTRPPEKMPYYLAVADAAIVTLRKHPTMAATIPNRIQSFLATGCPIVAAVDGEAARVILESSAGHVAPAENAQALAHCVLKLYKLDESDRVNMGISGRNFYLQVFDKTQVLNSFSKNLSQIGIQA